MFYSNKGEIPKSENTSSMALTLLYVQKLNFKPWHSYCYLISIFCCIYSYCY